MNSLKRLSEHKYYIFYKPYNVVNQFSKERAEHVTIADFMNVPKDVYPVGRLDKDSEGLLILTNDKSLNSLLLLPSKKHERTYLVQLDNDITDKAIQYIARGVQIKLDSGVYHTHPCIVKKLSKPPVLPDRNPPVRVRLEIPTSWALVTLIEGKNRQVRKMFASVGFPVLRLVRVQIEDVKLGKMNPGEHIEIKGAELYKLLKIDPADAVMSKRQSATEYVKTVVTKRAHRRSGTKTKTPVVDKPTTSSKEVTKTSAKSGAPATKAAVGRPSKDGNRSTSDKPFKKEGTRTTSSRKDVKDGNWTPSTRPDATDGKRTPSARPAAKDGSRTSSSRTNPKDGNKPPAKSGSYKDYRGKK